LTPPPAPPYHLPVQKTVVLNAVGLTPSLIGEHTPRLRAFRDAGRLAHVGPVLPAVTTTVQSTYLTGKWPGGEGGHGIVGNGWYFRDECEIKFWRQSNHLVQAPKIWDVARQQDRTGRFTCANLFWWYAMYSSADYTVTPRPMYPSDGRKLPDVWTHPPELRRTLQAKLGQFPLFKFWGPATDVSSTDWIARAAMEVEQRHDATLSLIYLPHLDYVLQRVGPDVRDPRVAKDLRALDDVCGTLIEYFELRRASVIVLCEYGISPVSRPVHLNRVLREKGLITVRNELGRELLDAGASKAFAVADHQVAHVYVNDPSKLEEVRRLIEGTLGVERVLDESGKREHHLDCDRSGELVAIASPGAWFTYYYWLDESRAPDFAHTVDIHRKPGYDPVELFIDPALKAPKLKIAATLAKRKLGFRSLLEVISTDPTLVKGSHGRPPANPDEGAMLMTKRVDLTSSRAIAPTDVFNVILAHLG
jgi:predicted AlkP superfamily pyrophosphatase or phosphodiesterase